MNKNLLIILFGVTLIFLGISMFINLSNERKLIELKTQNVMLQRRVDSLTSEMFVRDITISSYDYMLTLVEQIDSNIYKKVMHETE